MRDRLLKKTLRNRYIITLKSGETFDGLLDDWDRQQIVLIAASVVTESNARVKIDGDIRLDRVNIAYSQRPTQ